MIKAVYKRLNHSWIQKTAFQKTATTWNKVSSETPTGYRVSCSAYPTEAERLDTALQTYYSTDDGNTWVEFASAGTLAENTPSIKFRVTYPQGIPAPGTISLSSTKLGLNWSTTLPHNGLDYISDNYILVKNIDDIRYSEGVDLGEPGGGGSVVEPTVTTNIHASGDVSLGGHTLTESDVTLYDINADNVPGDLTTMRTYLENEFVSSDLLASAAGNASNASSPFNQEHFTVLDIFNISLSEEYATQWSEGSSLQIELNHSNFNFTKIPVVIYMFGEDDALNYNYIPHDDMRVLESGNLQLQALPAARAIAILSSPGMYEEA